MINSYNVNQYCCEDIRLIENYEQAVNDPTQTWHCHHRRETDLGLSPSDLIEQGKYFNVPANELIFLTKAEHSKVHHDGENSPMYGRRGKDSPNYASKRSEETKQKMRDNHYDCSGENNPMYGKNCEDYMSEEAIKERRKKLSENGSKYWSDENNRSKQSVKLKEFYSDPKNRKMIGDNTTGRTWMNNGYVRVYPKTQEEIEQYRKQGYHLGFKITKGEI